MPTSAISRRRVLAGLAGLPAGLLLARAGFARTAGGGPVRLGLVVPPASPAAEQARLGVEAGLREGNTFAQFFGKSLVLLVEEAAAAEEAARKAADLVRKGRVAALVGGVDEATARALVGVVAREAALFLNIGGRADELRGAACQRRAFHVQASDTMYALALAQWLAERRKVTRWGILAADSPRGRALREAAAGAVRKAGGTVAAEARLPGSGEGAAALRASAGEGAQAVFLAMESRAQLDTVRAAREAGVATPLAGAALEPAEFASPDLLGARAYWSSLWYRGWTRFSARELNRRFREDFGQPMQGLGWTTWAAVRLLAEAAVRTEETSPGAWTAFLESDYPFDGHKGEQLTVRPWDHQLRVTFGVLTPQAPQTLAEGADPYDSLADNVPRDPAALDARDESRCQFGS